MNRLQKKCAITIVGFHLLLLVILIVGPGFFAPKPRADDLQILDVIPANLIDAAFNSGVRNAQPPPPVVQPAPQPPAPQPVVTPPAPPKVVTPEPIKEIVKALTPEPKPVEKPKIQINTQLVTRTATKNLTPNPTDDSRRQQRLRQQAFQNAVRSLKENFKPGTVIDVPGNSSGPSYASYRDVLASIYYQAWEMPNDANTEDETVLVSVTIARDGTVISTRVITPSGNTAVDRSVQATLERVKSIAPFPDGMNEEQHTFQINFEPKIKKSIG
jgi:periplasmic protein TonB